MYYIPEETRRLREDMREDGNFIGGIVMLIAALLSLGFTVLTTVLVLTGKFTPEQIMQEDLGLGKTGYMVLYMCTYIVFMGLPPLLVCLLFGRRLPRITPPGVWVDVETRLCAFFIGLGGCAVANLVASYIMAMLDSVGITSPESPTFLESTPQSLCLNLVTMAVLPALLEEIAFRKCVLGTLQKYGNGTAIVVSALLFGVLHGGIAQSVFAFLMGLTFGLITVKTGNIRIAVAVHLVNNALSVLSEYVTLGADKTAQGLAYTMVVGVTGICGVTALIISGVRRNALLTKTPHTVSEHGALGVIWSAPLMVIAIIVLALRMLYINVL